MRILITNDDGIEAPGLDAMQQIAEEAVEEPELLANAPHQTVVGRLDEVRAARRPVLSDGSTP